MTPYDALIVGAVLGAYLVVAVLGAIAAHMIINYVSTRARSRAGVLSAPFTSSRNARPRWGTGGAQRDPGSAPEPGSRMTFEDRR